MTLSNIKLYASVQVHCSKTTGRTDIVDHRASKVQANRGGENTEHNKHVTVGINDFLAGRARTHQAQGKRTHL